MSFSDFINKKRVLLPRWQTFPVANILGTIQPLYKSKENDFVKNTSHKKKEQDWLYNQDIPYAAELVGSSFILNDFKNKQTKKAAELLIGHKNKISGLCLDLAYMYLSHEQPLDTKEESTILTDEPKNVRVQISNLKRNLKSFPNNPILCSDLAFYYMSLGEKEKSQKYINIALSLAMNNRFILNNSARFYVHLNDPERALYYLRKSALGNLDPWVISSEISISEAFELKTKRYKQGKNILSKNDILPFHLSELAGAMGTLELDSGSRKKGKALFKKALIDPTENTVAQVVWMGNIVDSNYHPANNIWEKSFEAKTRQNFGNGKYVEALQDAILWSRYQPFSTRAFSVASYIASVALEDFGKAIELCETGLKSAPENFDLLNCYAFASATLNKVELAENTINRINAEDLEPIKVGIYLATKGLIQFRKGDFQRGREYYNDAITQFKIIKNERILGLAYYFWAKEEKLAGDQSYMQLIDKCKIIVDRYEIKEISNLVNKIKASRNV